MRFELMTSSLPRRRSTPELRGRAQSDEAGKDEQSYPRLFILIAFILQPYFGAGDEIRTRDPQLGRLMLYQLSYTRPLRSQI